MVYSDDNDYNYMPVTMVMIDQDPSDNEYVSADDNIIFRMMMMIIVMLMMSNKSPCEKCKTIKQVTSV